MKPLFIYLFGWMILGSLLSTCSYQQGVMVSPDDAIQAVVYCGEAGQPFYTVTYHHDTVIAPSALGFVLNDVDYGRAVKNIKLLAQGMVHTQTKVMLKNRVIPNHYRYYHYRIYHDRGDYELHVRLYNEGIAYRYKFSGMGGTLQQERSSWTLADNYRVWFFERPGSWKLKTYAGLWQATVTDSLPIISANGPVQGKPLLFELPTGYMMFTEAALFNYSGMRFLAREGRVIQADFTEGTQGFNVMQGQLSPWRVALLAKDLDALVNNPVIAALNPLPDTTLFTDTNWIKPGKCVWSWWSRDDAYMTKANEERYIQQAVTLGFDYALLDDGWEKRNEPWPWLAQLVTYANDRGVGVWVWKDAHTIRDSVSMTCFLDSVKAAGVVGVKVDFMNSEEATWIDFDERLLKACARRQLMVNFHGCQTSTGEYVRYPNELTREGIRGLELNIMGKPLPASHNAALPFTRLVTGPADYTPLALRNPGETTWGHQLAMAVIMDSPFWCMAEDPGYILNTPGLQPVIPLLQGLPVCWDETHVLFESRIGKLATIARRRQNTWYLAFLNGESKAQVLTPDLTGWVPGPVDTLEIWRDDAAGAIQYSKSRSDGPLLVVMPPHGGMVIKLTTQNDI